MAKLKKLTIVFISGADKRYVDAIGYHLCGGFLENVEEIEYKNIDLKDLQVGPRALPYSLGSQKDFRYAEGNTPSPKLKGFEAKEPWALFSARIRYELEQLQVLIKKLEAEGIVDCLVVNGSLVDRLAYHLSDPHSSVLLESEYWELEVPKLVDLFVQATLGYPTIYAYLMFPSKSIEWSGANFGLTMAHHLTLTTLWSDLADARHRLGHTMDEGTNCVINSSFTALHIHAEHNNDEIALMIDLTVKRLASMYGYCRDDGVEVKEDIVTETDKPMAEEPGTDTPVDEEPPVDDNVENPLQHDNSYRKQEDDEGT